MPSGNGNNNGANGANYGKLKGNRTSNGSTLRRNSKARQPVKRVQSKRTNTRNNKLPPVPARPSIGRNANINNNKLPPVPARPSIGRHASKVMNNENTNNNLPPVPARPSIGQRATEIKKPVVSKNTIYTDVSVKGTHSSRHNHHPRVANQVVYSTVAGTVNPTNRKSNKKP